MRARTGTREGSRLAITLMLVCASSMVSEPVSAQHVICCKQLINVDGNWFGAIRLTKEECEKLAGGQQGSHGYYPGRSSLSESDQAMSNRICKQLWKVNDHEVCLGACEDWHGRAHCWPQPGSLIEAQRQVLRKDIAVAGAPFSLHYRSDWVRLPGDPPLRGLAADQLGGWTVGIHHAYDAAAEILYRGDGGLVLDPTLSHVAKIGDDHAVAGRRGERVFVFSGISRRHLRTLHALTGAIVHRFSYDRAGRLVAVEDGDGRLTRIERDGSGAPIAVVGPFGQRTALTMHDNGLLASVTAPDGGTVRLGYAQDRLLASYTDAGGLTTRYAYDETGRLAKAEDPAGGMCRLTRNDAAKGFGVTFEKALGRTTRYAVEGGAGNAERHVGTAPGGGRTTVLAAPGKSKQTTLPDGTVVATKMAENARWRTLMPASVSIRTPSGLNATYSVERKAVLADPGNPLSLTRQTKIVALNGGRYVREYDAARRQSVARTPAGREAVTTLDERGRVIREEVPGLYPTTFSYDVYGRPLGMRQGSGADMRAVAVEYGPQGYMTAITDPLNRTARFAYDAAGRMTQHTLTDGRRIAYAYDAGGKPVAVTPPGGKPHRFEFAPAGLLSGYRPPAAGDADGGASYAYNAGKELTRITRLDGRAIALSYDAAGHLSAAAYPGGTLRFETDPVTGHLKTVTAPDGGRVAYAYDGFLRTGAAWSGAVEGRVDRTYNEDLRVASHRVNGGGPIEYGYDADGLAVRAGALTLTRDAKNGLLLTTALGRVVTTRAYNGFGEVTRLDVAYRGSEIFALEYERDALGRVVTMREREAGAAVAYAYGYDPAGRLSTVSRNGVPAARYGYDENGNRLLQSGPGGEVRGSYDARDRMLSYGEIRFAHTADGERQSASGGRIAGYGHDIFGNLGSATLADGTRIEYVIDGPGRRIGRKVNGRLVQGFLYQDKLRPIAELDGAQSLVSRFVYATNSNVPDYMERDGKTYLIFADPLGSPRLVMDAASGAVVQRMDYDAFGVVLRDTRPGFQPFGFAGGLYDGHTGLTRFGARDYDPSTGRWTTTDPILFAGGQQNFYAYAANDPVNRRDPDGLQQAASGGGADPRFDPTAQGQPDVGGPMAPPPTRVSPHNPEYHGPWRIPGNPEWTEWLNKPGRETWHPTTWWDRNFWPPVARFGFWLQDWAKWCAGHSHKGTVPAASKA